MKKIEFNNNNSPALSKEILEALQDNVEEAIYDSEKKDNWKSINDVNITEGTSQTFSQIITSKEVMLVHEKNRIFLLTSIPRELSEIWIKNQNTDIRASMYVNFSNGQVSNGGSSDTNTWIKRILYR